jgi:sarcosine oxidase subunit beta
VDGLFHVTGFSGHGFMHAPAAGVVTAESMTGKPLSVDISEFKPGRFAEGPVVEETNVI